MLEEEVSVVYVREQIGENTLGFLLACSLVSWSYEYSSFYY